MSYCHRSQFGNYVKLLIEQWNSLKKSALLNDAILLSTSWYAGQSLSGAEKPVIYIALQYVYVVR